MASKKRLVSGIKPTGELHIGNYLGAMRQQLAYQKEYESFIFIADYHALTTTHDSELLRKDILHVAAMYLAAGIDPEKSVLYKQSDIPEHTELAWIFNSIMPMSLLLRGHAYKDAQAKKKDVTVGTFDYPMLMAADILMYDPRVVPVGRDQQQHIEIAKDTAEKFNTIYGETFTLPEGIIPEEVATIPGIDGQKMSKSYKNTISLILNNEELEKVVRSIVTDSKKEGEPKDPENDTVFALHRHFSTNELSTIEKRYREGSIGYKESKELLFHNLKVFIAPLREKYFTLIEDEKKIADHLAEGAAKARKVAQEKMRKVREKIGVSL